MKALVLVGKALLAGVLCGACLGVLSALVTAIVLAGGFPDVSAYVAGGFIAGHLFRHADRLAGRIVGLPTSAA